jgi:hypothetical protein
MRVSVVVTAWHRESCLGRRLVEHRGRLEVVGMTKIPITGPVCFFDFVITEEVAGDYFSSDAASVSTLVKENTR